MPCSCGESKCSCAEKCICLSKLCMCISCLSIKDKVTKKKLKRKHNALPSITKHLSLPETIKNKTSCSDSGTDTNNRAFTTQTQNLIEISNPGESDCEIIIKKTRNPEYKPNSSSKSSKTGSTDIEVVDLSQPEIIYLSEDNESDCEVVFEKLDRSIDQEHRDDMGKEHTAGTVNTLPNALKDKESSFEQAENISQEGSTVEDHKRDINDDRGLLSTLTNLQTQKKLRLSNEKNRDLPLSVNIETKSQPDSSVPELLDFDDPKNKNNANTETDGSKQSIEKAVLNTISENLSVSSVEDGVQSKNKSPILINTDTGNGVIPSKKDEDEKKVSNCDQSVTFSNSGTQTDCRGRKRNRKRSSYNGHQFRPVYRNNPSSAVPKPFVDANAIYAWEWQQNWTHTIEPWRRQFDFYRDQRRNNICSRKYMHQPSMNKKSYFKTNLTNVSSSSSNVASTSKSSVAATSKLNVSPTSKPNVSPTSKPNVAPTSKPNVTSTSTLTVASKPTVNVASKSTVNVASNVTLNVASKSALKDASSSTLTEESKSTVNDSSVLTKNNDSNSILNDAFSACVKKEILDEEEYVPKTVKKEPDCTDVEQENIFIKKEII